MAMQVLVELGKVSSTQEASTDDSHPYPRAALRLILSRILHAQGPSAEALDDLLHSALERYGDIRFEAYSMLPELLKEMKEGEAFEQAAGRVILQLGAIEVETGFRRTLVALPESVTKKAAVRCRSGHKSAYTACWLSLLPLIPSSSLSLHKRVLSLLDDTVIPQMTRPQLLIDYLTDAYNAGGILSLMALGSLFTLIRKHNLDYPEFYTRLYALLDGRILHIAYRRRFLRLLDLFMQSTMLPVWLVAAFVKRMARLALWAPAPSLQWIIPFIYNLLKRHPGCRVLIHREGEAGASLQSADPYDATEPDPAACKALQSSLWELSALSRHHWAPIARQAKIFSERFTKPPMDLGKVLDEEAFTYEEIVKAELGHRWSKRPPTAIDIPTTPF